MSLYLVKHASGDWRLHRSDGSEITTWSSDPREDSNGNPVTPIPAFVDGIAGTTSTSGDAVLGDPQGRTDHVMAVAGDWNYRDLTLDGETVPW